MKIMKQLTYLVDIENNTEELLVLLVKVKANTLKKEIIIAEEDLRVSIAPFLIGEFYVYRPTKEMK